MKADSMFVRIAKWLGWTPRFIEPKPIAAASMPALETPIVASPSPALPPPALPTSAKPPCQSADQALGELYEATLAYRKSAAYRGLLDYIGRFRNYSSYNLFLVRIQKPDARYIATTKHWKQAFGRSPKPGVRPLMMLQPGGPVMFVYDLPDTEGKPAPPTLLDPFYAEGEVPKLVWETVLKNCRREGFTVAEVKLPANQAGSVSGSIGEHSNPPYFEIRLNAVHTETARFVTLVHELAHIYCGHLGGHPRKRWPHRSDLALDVREFEAESVAYIVTIRRGIASGSDRYLSEYLTAHTEVPPVDVELVIRVSDRIEKMGHALRPLRKNQSEDDAN
jgi:hypothetical protein